MNGERSEQELELERILFEGLKAAQSKRFLLGPPIVYGVWRAYVASEDRRVDLLLVPETDVDPVRLAQELKAGLERISGDTGPSEARLAYTGTYVAAKLTFAELVHAAMPLTRWWRDKIDPKTRETSAPEAKEDREWLMNAIEVVRDSFDDELEDGLPQPDEKLKPAAKEPILSLVTLNRRIQTAVVKSRRTVKADAAAEVFGLDTSDLRWAVIDNGIDARHPAFRQPGYKQPFSGGVNRTRILETYDFTLLRDAQTAALTGIPPADPRVAKLVQDHQDLLTQLGSDLSRERPLDWKLLAPLLRIPHKAADYIPPPGDHGTHIAGVLAADWDSDEGLRQGVCPRLELYDLRVFDPKGEGDEFAITAALQFVDYLNGYGRKIVVQGANVSLSVPYDFDVFACGQTPVCREANRLAAAGAVVVAAAGNEGSSDFSRGDVTSQGFRPISITDPGNADGVITVGSTHTTNPHAYGVSFFSSRGPTGDGRPKPDLVAPGERIFGPVRDGGWGELDGTSQSAAHVSGAAALLLARHRELIGDTAAVKRILCSTATDLSRERDFQGAGLVDALRALEAV